MAKRDGIERATGRSRAEWFDVLDAAGMGGRPYREVSDWLTGKHNLTKWWAQKLIVEYEQARGLRAPGVRPDGTFEVTASRTVDVSVERLFDAFVTPSGREVWLADARPRLRTAEKPRTARFDWADGTSRVNVDFVAKGPSRSAVSVAHARLPDAAAAEAEKAAWRERLSRLKSSLESEAPTP